MPRRNPITSSNTKKKFIHHNLMIGKSARKTIGSNGILEIRTKLPNPSGDIKRRVFWPLKDLKKVFSGLEIRS